MRALSTGNRECTIEADTELSIRNIFLNSKNITKDILAHEYCKDRTNAGLSQLIMRHVILTHFEKQYLPKDFLFVPTFKRIYRQKILHLYKDDVLLTLNAADKNVLPRKAGYKERYSKHNSHDFTGRMISSDSKIIDDRVYGIITYKYKNDDYEYIDIILPSPSYSRIIDSINIYSGSAQTQQSLFSDDIVYADDSSESILSNESLKSEIKEAVMKQIHAQ